MKKSIYNFQTFCFQLEGDLTLLRDPEISDDQISKIEDSVRREEEEDRERLIAKEKWLKEREEKKRSIQVKNQLFKKFAVIESDFILTCKTVLLSIEKDY